MDLEPAPALASFRAVLGTSFSVERDDGAPVDLTLVEVTEVDRHPDWESFSLFFDGPRGVLAQGTYPVRHPAMEPFGLFLVPIQSAADEQKFQAVFNRQRA